MDIDHLGALDTGRRSWIFSHILVLFKFSSFQVFVRLGGLSLALGCCTWVVEITVWLLRPIECLLQLFELALSRVILFAITECR